MFPPGLVYSSSATHSFSPRAISPRGGFYISIISSSFFFASYTIYIYAGRASYIPAWEARWCPGQTRRASSTRYFRLVLSVLCLITFDVMIDLCLGPRQAYVMIYMYFLRLDITSLLVDGYTYSHDESRVEDVL